MIQNVIEKILKRRATLLGIGPMSINCVNAAIELANDHNVPLFFVASRRQIDSEEFGGGYVEKWTTEQFANYVMDHDKRGRIILCRDHGGPWQNEKEKREGLSLRRAMESAKSSFRSDIEAGFQILHIDPSIDVHYEISISDVLERIYELYEFCYSYAQRLDRNILFEIGTEEQSGTTNSQEELEFVLDSMRQFCKRYRLPMPTFVVIQTGTRVMETRNVGSLDSPIRVADEIAVEIQMPKMIEICNHYGILMKQHNTDYLSDEALQWHPRLGIHAANVAPEFGVVETRALIKILETNGLRDLSEQFIDLAYSSLKWEKWIISDSRLSKRDCAVIAGHYVFSHEDCLQIKSEAISRLGHFGINLDLELKEAIKSSIQRYMECFRLTGLA